MTEQTPHAVHQEPEGVDGRLVAWIVTGTVAMTLLCVFVARALLHADVDPNAARTPEYPVAETVGGIDQLPIDDRARGKALNEEGSRSLHEYGWTDQRHGVARIPIERAMQWFADDARRGSLHDPDPATTTDAGTPREAR
jgi:hypothetical protein